MTFARPVEDQPLKHDYYEDKKNLIKVNQIIDSNSSLWKMAEGHWYTLTKSVRNYSITFASGKVAVCFPLLAILQLVPRQALLQTMIATNIQ